MSRLRSYISNRDGAWNGMLTVLHLRRTTELKELIDAVTKLQIMLEDPKPELTTWCVAVDQQINKIATIWQYAELDKRPV
jgi:hypothetical protein